MTRTYTRIKPNGRYAQGESAANKEKIVHRLWDRLWTVGLLVASVDAVRTRRRDLASLAALGVPVGVLRRALLLEVSAPLVGCLAVAVGAGAFAAAAYLSADTYYRETVGLPWGAWGSATGLAAAVVLAVTALTLPLARGAARPEHLRTE